MPEQTTGELPSLYGGFSTQAKHQRHPTQVDEAINVSLSVMHGFAKRNGSRFIAYITPIRMKVGSRSGSFAIGDTLTGPTGVGTIVSVSPSGNWLNVDNITGTFSSAQAVVGGSASATTTQIQTQLSTGAALRIFPIYRDTSERYLAIMATASVPRIISVFGGPEAEVTCSSGALTYFGSTSAVAADMRLFSIADTTLICNSKKIISGNAGAGTIDATTMPHLISRTGLSPLAFNVDVATWKPRASGNNTTNPLPTIWNVANVAISDLCLHRERLWLGAGPRMQGSQAADYFNFWIEDATNLVDSDPIDIALPGKEITYVDRLTPYRKTILAFTKSSAQFEMSAPDLLTPSTAAFTPSTSYDTMAAAPASMVNGLVFVAKNQFGTTLYSYEYNDLQVASSATPLSFHINGTLPTDVSKVVSSSNQGFAACIAPSEPDTVFVYFEHWVGNQRVQEAWAKWEFPGLARICDIATIEGVLYVVGETHVSNQYVVEGIVIGSSLSSTNEKIAPSGGSTSINDESNPVPDE